MKTSLFARFAIASLAAVVAACGSSGGSGNLGGIDRLSATGPVSAFGSIIVNGVEWRTNAAAVDIDGQNGMESDLQVGQIVTIAGVPDADGLGGQAESVKLQNNVTGVVLNVDPTTRTFAILGQIIYVNADTSTDPLLPFPGLDGISVGDTLGVSGYVDSAGTIRATRIQLAPASATQSLIGAINTINVAAKTLTIGGLTVDYNAATPSGFAASGPAAGDLVFASGTYSGNQLLATALEFQTKAAPGATGEKGEVEGLISAFTSVDDFRVHGVRVLNAGSAQFGHGTAADLKLNAKVEVDGQIDGSGRIVASRVSIKAASADQKINIVQNVEAVDTTAKTLTVFGIKVQLDSETRLEDRSTTGKRPFALADIAVGDQLRVRGVVQPANATTKVLATRVEREDVDSGDIVLQGPVEVVNGNSGVTVLGATIETDNLTFFFNGSTAVQSAAEFYPLVQAGTIVRALSSASSVTGPPFVITANELRIIPDNDDE